MNFDSADFGTAAAVDEDEVVELWLAGARLELGGASEGSEEAEVSIAHAPCGGKSGVTTPTSAFVFQTCQGGANTIKVEVSGET